MLGPRRLSVKRGLFRSIAGAIRFDLARRSRTARLRRVLEGWKVPAPMRGRILDMLERQARVEQQIIRLQPFQRLFRYWHVFHVPLAAVMFLIPALHVTVAIMFGYGWPG